MEFHVAGLAGLMGLLDALTTHIGLRGRQVEEVNPLWRHLYRRLPLVVFLALLAGGQSAISLAIFHMLGDAGQLGHLAVSLIVPVSNTLASLRARKKA